MSLARVQFFSISLDGFGTGEGQSHDAPFGHAGERLHQWMFATRWWREMTGQPGGSNGVDNAFVQQHVAGIGAEIMGAGKFGFPGWHEDPEWKGWWGPNPPFHTPVFVLTHHTRPSIEMEGGTTFHFIDASPAEALETARKAAGGQDVRIGGGATVIRDFLAARLVDHMHIVVVPILLGRGVRLWDGLEGLEKDYQIGGHLLTQWSDACDVQPCRHLNCLERKGHSVVVDQRCATTLDRSYPRCSRERASSPSSEHLRSPFHAAWSGCAQSRTVSQHSALAICCYRAANHGR